MVEKQISNGDLPLLFDYEGKIKNTIFENGIGKDYTNR